MRPNIRPIPAIILLVLISALVYSVLLTASNDKELIHEQEVIKCDESEDGITITACDITDLNITIPDSTGTDFIITEVETADFSMTPAPSIEWEWSISEMPDDPNESEPTYGSMAVFEPPTAHYDITQLIPTWPDYIELEKDLVIHRPGKTIDEFYVWFFNKGTKIYFKNDK